MELRNAAKGGTVGRKVLQRGEVSRGVSRDLSRSRRHFTGPLARLRHARRRLQAGRESRITRPTL